MPGSRLRALCLPNHYQCHDGAVTVRSVSSCLAKIDITDDLSALVVQSGTLCHRKRHLLYNPDTSLWIVRRTYCITMAADRPPHAAHTVGNGALQVSRTNSGIRSLPVLVSADLLVPIHEQDHYRTLQRPRDSACSPGALCWSTRPYAPGFEERLMRCMGTYKNSPRVAANLPSSSSSSL